MVQTTEKSGIPVLRKKSYSSKWMISYYDEFERLLFPDSNLCPEIINIINFSEKTEYVANFRREIIIEGVPLLVGVKGAEKAILVGCRKLSRELTLLEAYEIHPLHDDLSEKLIFQLKDHVHKISSISTSGFPTEIEWVTFSHQLPDFWNKQHWEKIELDSRQSLKILVKKVSKYQSSTFEKFSDWGLSLTAQYDLIRVHLLKFLALLPSLDHDKSGHEVKRNLIESFRRLKEDSNGTKQVKQLPFWLQIIFSMAAFVFNIMPPHLLASIVRYLVRLMAKRFIAGEGIATSNKTIRELRLTGRQATLDQLGELVVSAKEADEYFEKVLQLIHGLKNHIPRGEKNGAGIYSAHVSIKVSALSHEFKPQAFESTYAKVAPRLRRILLEAAREEVFINIDAEHYHYRDLVFKIYGKVLLETPELKNFSQTGIVVQAYLRDGAKHLLDVVQLAKKRGLIMPIRLVKGAYWDAETIEGEAHQFIAPQFLNKEESDIHFRQLAWLALKNHEFIQLAIGSHNLQDHAFVESLRKIQFPQAPVIEHQCLHMTYEALSYGLVEMGWPTRNYMPIGNLLVGMAYLVRRIMENSSQVGVLSIMRSHQKATGLISPIEVHQKKKAQNNIQHDSMISIHSSSFAPVRPVRLFLEDELRALENSIGVLGKKLNQSQEVLKNDNGSKIISSSNPDLVLGIVPDTSSTELTDIVNKAKQSLHQSEWSKESSVLIRVGTLLKAADLMLMKRNELSALIVYEAGKTMTEALADVDEAIDFINFYAREEVKLHLNGLKITNRGIIAVIAPWNFPLAIPCGMAVAPLVAGNAVILKPAEQTPLIAIELHRLMLEAGVPASCFQLVFGDGEVVGAPLVQHPDVAGIVFTGSKAVGTWIYREAGAAILPHYRHQFLMQKKIITEMGGKNAIIVTNNCELDETVSGILYSAFGHAGQKCSAASRVIVHKEVREALVKRLYEAIRDIKVGEAYDPSTSINPLISEADQSRVRRIVEEAKDEVIKNNGKIIIDRSFEKLPGFCVGPVLLEIPLHSAMKKESWAMREIFGPVIHVIEYESLMEAIELFNSTEYALTGGIYAQSQDDIDFLLQFLKAGNIYVNRPNTGARVAIEPFGGFKLSGTGPKAGGKGYLEQFHFTLVNEMNATKTNDNWISSTGYQMIAPYPSQISIQGRLNRFEKLTQHVMNSFESILGKINPSEKLKFEKLISWTKTNLAMYVNSKHLNHVIPGQLSYNDKSLIKEAGLFVMVNPFVTSKALEYFLSAAAIGCGISIVCATQEAYSLWKEIVDNAHRAGYAKVNMDVGLLSPSEINELFMKDDFCFVYADELHKLRDDIYKNLLNPASLTKSMRQILSDHDGLVIDSPAVLFDQFVWMRSMAINTMRHGAPLELNG